MGPADEYDPDDPPTFEFHFSDGKFVFIVVGVPDDDIRTQGVIHSMSDDGSSIILKATKMGSSDSDDDERPSSDMTDHDDDNDSDRLRGRLVDDILIMDFGAPDEFKFVRKSADSPSSSPSLSPSRSPSHETGFQAWADPFIT